MFQAVLNAVLVCHHRRTTFPVTPGRVASALPKTYIVCLDCGRELPYDWTRMTVVSSRSCAPESVCLELCESVPAASTAVLPAVALPAAPNEAGVQTPVSEAPPAPILPAATARTDDRPQTASASGQYLVRAKLRIQQVQVALRVLNALMTGLSVQPDDVAQLRSWTDASHQACSPRDLAQRIVACAVSP